MGLFSKKKEVLVCPKCGSIDKEPTGSMPLNYVAGSGFTGRPSSPSLYKCKKCDFEGPFFLIDESELEAYRKDLKKSR